MDCRRLFAAACLVVCTFVPSGTRAATTTTVVDIPTRGVIQRILYVRPDFPIATIVNVPGNDGILGIQNDGSLTTLTGRCGAIGRNRDALAASGIAVALVDQASDGTIYNFADILEVIRYVRGRADVPTWISGGSASTATVVGFAASSPADQPVGLIVGAPNVLPPTAASVKHPAVVVYHVDDVAAASFAQALLGSFTNAAAKELFALTGGDPGDCGGAHNFWGLDGVYVQTISGAVTKYNALLAAALPRPDLNQHGLTGSWYEAATGGQGVEVEVFANPSAGTGSTFVSWFTYDTVSGGAERQRWYTAQGPVVTGQPNAALTIYRNTGGNFNAPPVTNAQAVGTATLSFNTCTSGQLAYAFTDGTGRIGTIPLTRLTQNVTCSSTSAYPTNADFALSGNWYDPATDGQGFTVEVNPNSGALFAAWYTYQPNGTAAGPAGQRWYTAQAAFTPGLRTMPVTIYETKGGVFDTPTPPGQNTVPVGTGTMAFQSCSAATFSYNFTGGSSIGSSGTINLRRVGPVPPGCTT